MRTRALGALLGILAGLGSAAPAAALEPLDAFVKAAERHSYDARESVATADQRDAEASASLGKLLPALTARGTYTRNQRETAVNLDLPAPPNGPGGTKHLVITPLNQLDGLIQLDVPLIDVSSYHRYGAATATTRAARLQTAAARVEISRAVAQSYFMLLGATGLTQAAAHSVSAAESNLATVDARVSAGVGTELDRARATANLERARQDQADAELSVALSARRLETLSGMTPSPAAEVPSDDLKAEAPLAQFLGLAGNTPSEKVARANAEAIEKGKKSADAAYLPTLAAVGQERFTNATGFSGSVASYNIQLILALRLDYATFVNDDAQTAALEVQRIRAERTGRAVSDAIFEAYRRVEAGIAKSKSARAQEAASARAADLASERYGAGAATQLDVTQAQRDLYTAAASRSQADADLAYSRASLRLAAGLPLAGPRKP